MREGERDEWWEGGRGRKNEKEKGREERREERREKREGWKERYSYLGQPMPLQPWYYSNQVTVFHRLPLTTKKLLPRYNTTTTLRRRCSWLDNSLERKENRSCRF